MDLTEVIPDLAPPKELTAREQAIESMATVIMEAHPELKDVIGEYEQRRRRMGELILASVETAVKEARDEDARLATEEAARDARPHDEVEAEREAEGRPAPVVEAPPEAAPAELPPADAVPALEAPTGDKPFEPEG